MSTIFTGGRTQKKRFYKKFLNGRLSIWSWGFFAKLSKYKGLEVEWLTNSIYCFELGIYIWHKPKGKIDHHGVNIELSLGWWKLSLDFYDSRHVEQMEQVCPACGKNCHATCTEGRTDR